MPQFASSVMTLDKIFPGCEELLVKCSNTNVLQREGAIPLTDPGLHQKSSFFASSNFLKQIAFILVMPSWRQFFIRL